MHKNQDQPDCQRQINILIIHESSRSRKQIARKTQIVQLYPFSGHLQYTNPSSYLSMKNQHQLEIQGTANLPLPRNQNPMRTKNGKNNIFAQKKRKKHMYIYIHVSLTIVPRIRIQVKGLPIGPNAKRSNFLGRSISDRGAARTPIEPQHEWP